MMIENMQTEEQNPEGMTYISPLRGFRSFLKLLISIIIAPLRG